MDDQEDVYRTSVEGKSAKERPIWLRESTVQGAYSSEEMKEGKSRISKMNVLGSVENELDLELHF
jgi:hypothetical protein